MTGGSISFTLKSPQSGANSDFNAGWVSSRIFEKHRHKCAEQHQLSFVDLLGKLFWIRWHEPPLMNIEIHDTALEARIQKQIQVTGAASAEEALLRLLETQEEQDRWLLENKNDINAKIRRGIDQLDRGEGILEDQLDAYLAKVKAKPE